MTTSKTPTTRRFTATYQAMARQMGKSAALGAMYGGGPGTPSGIMTTHLKRRLTRYRQVRPFPLKPREFFETVYPIELFLERTSNDKRWQNLAKALNVEPVAHFHLEGRDPTHETFWVRNDQPVPAPADLSLTLEFPLSNPHYGAVTLWVTEALAIHARIDDAMEHLREFINTAMHPEHVRTYWPELLPFIGELPPSVMKHVEKLHKKNLSIPDKPKRDEITDLLATCSLLSDVESVAWVKFPENAT